MSYILTTLLLISLRHCDFGGQEIEDVSDQVLLCKNFKSRAEICDKIIDSVNMGVKFSQCIDDGTLPIWKTKPAPPLAINYWKLKVFKKIFS